MKISDHISYNEATASITAQQLGIDNTPTVEHLNNMRDTAVNVFEPLRLHFGKPIGIRSFYRSPALNLAVGGADKSQHMTGQAVDIDADIYGNLNNGEIFTYICNNLVFDQLIWEFGNDENPDWVHVSFNHGQNRREVLRSVMAGGKTKYLPFLNT